VIPVAVIAVLALGAVGCSDDGPGPGEAQLEVDGVAQVRRADGERERVTGDALLHRGDRVEVTRGEGELELPDGQRLELRAAFGNGTNTAVTVDDAPVLEQGDLLVIARDAHVELEAAETEITVESGAARVSRYLGVDLGIYSGRASVESAGAVRDVRALRRLSVPVLGRPARTLRPVRYDADDPWDRRYLGAAMALGEQLQGYARAYTASLEPGEGRSAGFYRLVLPSLENDRDFDQRLLTPRRAPGEFLVGAAITDLGDGDSFVERWREVFSFRDEGAPWGLVALDQRVDRGPLLESVEDALSVSPFEFTAPPATSTTAPTEPPATSPPPTTGPSPTAPPPPTQPTTAPPPTPAAPTTPITQPEVLDPVIEPENNPIGDLLDDFLGGILGGG
jgi:hypothetical protein